MVNDKKSTPTVDKILFFLLSAGSPPQSRERGENIVRQAILRKGMIAIFGHLPSQILTVGRQPGPDQLIHNGHLDLRGALQGPAPGVFEVFGRRGGIANPEVDTP